MKRRAFIGLLGGAAAWPLAARAQQQDGMRHIGYLNPGRPVHHIYAAFVEGLRQLGWVEGKNLSIDSRYADNDVERLHQLATELVRGDVEIIVATGTLGPLAAKRATTKIPIVMSAAGDPLGSGLIASLARPGGNITGMSLMAPDLGGKRLEILREILPTLSRVAVLWNAANPYPVVFRLAAPAVDILVKYAGVADLQVGDDEACVGPFRAGLDTGDDPLDAAPAGGPVEDLFEAARLAFLRRGLEPRLRAGLEALDVPAQRRGRRDAQDVIETGGSTPVKDFGTAIMAVGAQQDLSVGPVGADRPQQAAQQGADPFATRPFGGPKHRCDEAALGVEHDDRLKAIILRALAPGMSRVAMLWDSSNPGMAARVHETEIAAARSDVVLRSIGPRNLDELQAAFHEIGRQRPDALLVTTEAFTRRYLRKILDFASTSRLPAMFEDSTYVEAGGLMSYGPDNRALFRRAAVLVDKVLKGAKPADLPVEQPTKFDLVINLKTAKALGLEIPPTLLARADEVIE